MDASIVPFSLSSAWLESAAYLMVTLIITRFVAVSVGRACGFYSPDQYHRWPRLPWRPVFEAYITCRIWYERVFLQGKRGSTGGFTSTLALLCLLYKPSMVHLGRATAFGFGLLQPIGMKVSRHLFMLAMTGTGKTTALITLLSLWRGSAFVIDPKAQIVDALLDHDPRQLWVFDPDGLSQANSVSINFMDCIKEAVSRDGEAAAVLWSLRIAEAIVVTPSGSKSPYFFDVSRQFLAGVILHVLTTHPETDHHLPFVRDLIVRGYQVFDESGKELTQGTEAHDLLLDQMSKNFAYDGAIAGAAAAMLNASGDTGGNVRSTLIDQTKFLDLPNVRQHLRHSDVSLTDLKTRDDVILAFTSSIYSLREEHSRLSRLLTNMVAYSFEAVKARQGLCLFVIDELPSQGYNGTLEVLLAVARSMGLIFLGVSQNLELMKKHYPNSWKSFVGEADATFWMGGNHPDNAQFLSERLGQVTQVKTHPVTGQTTTRDVHVMEPEQVARYLDPNSDNLIVTRAGARALKLKNDPYFKALPIWRYRADPEHGDRLLRRCFRAWWGQRIHKPSLSAAPSDNKAPDNNASNHKPTHNTEDNKPTINIEPETEAQIDTTHI